jgi:hypothetical protein
MLKGIVGRVMRTEFRIEIAKNPDPDGVGHKPYSKLTILGWS